MTEFVPIIGTLFLVILILYLSYQFSKYVGGKSVRFYRSKYMDIIDRIMIGQDRTLFIVRIGTKNYLISTSAAETRLLSEIAEEDLLSLQENNGPSNNQMAASFQEILSKLKKK